MLDSHFMTPTQKRKAARDYYWRNREAALERSREWHLKNYSIRTIAKRQSRLERYAALQQAQDGKCAICNKKRKLELHLDAITGQTKGLLCHGCNIGLGWMDKLFRDEEWFDRANAYLGPDESEETNGPTTTS